MSQDTYYTATPPKLNGYDTLNSDALLTGSVSLTATGPGTFFKTPAGSTMGLYGVLAVTQPTTAITGLTVAGTGAGTVLTTTTFGGYTLAQIAAALAAVGILSTAA